ncbi:IS110 family RNA-guided transposase [Microbispora bryophytorum]|uniref:IS110 family transposase n=1 Tax=Microbispora bryophytorum TaxID=1460882 RepID=UPI00168B8316|nr:IS110 family transposase [Microbispora bryophytorum]MBD3141562.1 IS110 family transposase [Microbispora bryophytorum]
MTPQQQQDFEVAGGVDTHQDTHTAAVIDPIGRVLGTEQFPADPAGYAALLAWMRSFGPLQRVGVEGTGVYGAGLARLLRDQGVCVIEVDRPDRKTRRFQGKSDPIDAISAAKTALAGERTGTPKQRDGRIEAVRNLRVARRSAVDQRADAQRQIKALIVTAPDDLRERLRGLPVKQLISICAGLRPDQADTASPATAAKIALRSLARRHQRLSEEIDELDALLDPLVAAINPRLVAANGVGTDVAGQLLVTAGENHERLTSEAAFAMLCGAAPIPASSGKTTRHRLNRGGDRQANKALYRVVICRLRWDPRTRAYMARRTKDGLSKKEIIRCLKRYVARELYRIITTPNDQKLAA